ncbi:MAG: ATP-binding protein [Pseudomonadota bacterium]|nr:ATP-binding protein [Pseudomonadota bacterium]
MSVLRYADTMAGRLFVLLLVGTLGSAALVLAYADAQRRADLRGMRADRLADRLSDFLSLVDRAREPLRAYLLATPIGGTRAANGHEVTLNEDAALTAVLSAHVGRHVHAVRADAGSCDLLNADQGAAIPFECWVVGTTLSDGTPINLQLRARTPEESYALRWLVALFLTPGIAIVAFLVARMASAPLRALSRAAQALGGDLDRRPIDEVGPREVRDAARAFNVMQAELRNSLVEKTQLLASITHDLQTPMTRLRLRLERVTDDALRSRLIDDVATMQGLIREGLNYARHAQTSEPVANIALDNLLEVVVEDAMAATGKNVTFSRHCGCDVEVRPRALQRCLSNLLDNALKYGNSAEVSATAVEDTIRVVIRDHGPGIPPDKLQSVFDPFVRLESTSRSADGVGLGLTIAKMLAEKNDASLTLRNHEEGGLEVLLVLENGVARTAG